jgi:hypothetical protein
LRLYIRPKIGILVLIEGYEAYMPATFIIDKQGNIENTFIGYRSKEVFEDEITRILKEKNTYN